MPSSWMWSASAGLRERADQAEALEVAWGTPSMPGVSEASPRVCGSSAKPPTSIECCGRAVAGDADQMQMQGACRACSDARRGSARRRCCSRCPVPGKIRIRLEVVRGVIDRSGRCRRGDVCEANSRTATSTSSCSSDRDARATAPSPKLLRSRASMYCELVVHAAPDAVGRPRRAAPARRWSRARDGLEGRQPHGPAATASARRQGARSGSRSRGRSPRRSSTRSIRSAKPCDCEDHRDDVRQKNRRRRSPVRTQHTLVGDQLSLQLSQV